MAQDTTQDTIRDITQDLDIRRHPDGGIDFDFYRRQARRRRQAARSRVFRRCLAFVAEMLRKPQRVREDFHENRRPVPLRLHRL
jgi:hypothetical protein